VHVHEAVSVGRRLSGTGIVEKQSQNYKETGSPNRSRVSTGEWPDWRWPHILR